MIGIYFAPICPDNALLSKKGMEEVRKVDPCHDFSGYDGSL
ncbi:MAG: hypothetical protein ABF506_00495 [Zymomonas mobilis]